MALSDTLVGLGFSEEMTLAEARALLREYVEDGAPCPCCTQFAKVYKRKLHAAMAAALIRFYRAHGQAWADWPGRQSDEAKLRYWGLAMEGIPTGSNAGLWRVTDLGADFVRGLAKVQSHARVYDGRCLGLTGDPVTIRDALGQRFDYAELMSE